MGNSGKLLPQKKEKMMKSKINPSVIISWIFGLTVFAIGLLNLILVHPVPGIVYMILSSAFFPPINFFLKRRLGFSIPAVVKIILGIIIIWFTLGMSDLAEMYGF